MSLRLSPPPPPPSLLSLSLSLSLFFFPPPPASQGDRAYGRSKKGGGGGAYTWGLAGEEELGVSAALDSGDPNYDSDADRPSDSLLFTDDRGGSYT